MISGTSNFFAIGSGMKEFLKKNGRGAENLVKVMKMRNLSDFNSIYKIQEVFILDVILEYRMQKIKDERGFDSRCFTSASTLVGAIERRKSKVIC